jgi:hypothetical protein
LAVIWLMLAHCIYGPWRQARWQSGANLQIRGAQTDGVWPLNVDFGLSRA